jgi:hypothetical protein
VYEKFLGVQNPFFKKGFGRRRSRWKKEKRDSQIKTSGLLGPEVLKYRFKKGDKKRGPAENFPMSSTTRGSFWEKPPLDPTKTFYKWSA